MSTNSSTSTAVVTDKWDEHYDDPDACVVLRTMDHVLFRASAHNLSRGSSVFKSMCEAAFPGSQTPIDVEVNAKELRQLLFVISVHFKVDIFSACKNLHPDDIRRLHKFAAQFEMSAVCNLLAPYWINSYLYFSPVSTEMFVHVFELASLSNDIWLLENAMVRLPVMRCSGQDLWKILAVIKSDWHLPIIKALFGQAGPVCSNPSNISLSGIKSINTVMKALAELGASASKSDPSLPSKKQKVDH